MDLSRFDRSIQTLAQATGRRDAVRSLGASGLALLAALGLADASAKGPGKGDGDRVQADGKGGKGKKRKTKRGPAGPAGPSGPAGVAEFTTRMVSSAESPALGTVATDSVGEFADCGGEGKVVSCGYQMSGAATEWASVYMESFAPDTARTGCGSNIRRTVDVSSTSGVTIRVFAVCLA